MSNSWARITCGAVLLGISGGVAGFLYVASRSVPRPAAVDRVSRQIVEKLAAELPQAVQDDEQLTLVFVDPGCPGCKELLTNLDSRPSLLALRHALFVAPTPAPGRPYPVLVDSAGEVADAFRIWRVPQVVTVAVDGRIVRRWYPRFGGETTAAPEAPGLPPGSDPAAARRRGVRWNGHTRLGSEEAFLQAGLRDCGRAAIAQVFRCLGLEVAPEEIRRGVPLGSRGASMLDLKRFAEAKGLGVDAVRLPPSALDVVPLPVLTIIDGRHFVVMVGVSRGGGLILMDPALGWIGVGRDEFLRRWRGESLLFRRSAAPRERGTAGRCDDAEDR